jgi:hypothetical protein
LGADPAPIRVAGPADLAGGKGRMRGHGAGGSSARMVANSKSMMQNRPSLWR